MVDIETFRKAALSLPETTEEPHFEKTSFRVRGKIFATLDIGVMQTCLKLSEIDQDIFSVFDPNAIFPVPNKWGKQGWTLVNLPMVPKEMLMDALTAAYCQVAPKKLAALLKRNNAEL